ncbi:MAG: hypothetical protein JWO38_7274 [Gemmataceae bacterium]|nr:hypothetical protein [Gemmataceae bacterium]
MTPTTTDPGSPPRRPAPAAGPWFTWLQLAWLGLQLVGLAVYAGVLDLQTPDEFGLLWRDPQGRKMAAGAAASLGVQTAVYLGGCLVLNWLAARMGPRRLATYRGLCVGLAAFCFVAFYLPVTFVLKAGPAAVQLQRNLQAG